jgi:hypothetical protein
VTNNGVKSDPIMVDTSKGGDTYLFFVPHHFWLILLLPKSMDGLLSVMFFFFLGVVHAHGWEEGLGSPFSPFVFLLVWNMQLQTILYNLVIRIGVPTSIILLFQLVAQGTEVGQRR